MKNSETSEALAIKYLGRISISLVVLALVCILACLGYTTYVKIHPNKEIEVLTEKNSNSIN